jgi:hypothetical protein
MLHVRIAALHAVVLAITSNYAPHQSASELNDLFPVLPLAELERLQEARSNKDNTSIQETIKLAKNEWSAANFSSTANKIRSAQVNMKGPARGKGSKGGKGKGKGKGKGRVAVVKDEFGVEEGLGLHVAVEETASVHSVLPSLDRTISKVLDLCIDDLFGVRKHD